jgi:lipopolysaccharide/colanic/teichoic acid biosynthesis glycosyltransferase
VLILGRKYKFTPLELEELNKKFDNINIVKYRNRDENEVLEELKEYTKQNDFDLLVLNTKAKVENNIIKYLTKLQFEKRNKKVRIITIEHFLEEFLFKCYIPDEHNDLNFLENIKPYSKWQYIQKRAIDFFGIFWLFFFSWPVMLYSAYRIKKESPDGPIFFKQKRVGLNDKEFVCVKFRSMIPDAEKGKPKFASKDDPRVFRWGAIMRKTRIDELPQMWNILKGEMHLIGPRPERKVWTDQFEEQIPYYAERHLIKPGITGWAQVMYPYGANAEDAKQKLMYDLYYIKHWSIILEMKVVWKTVMVVVGKKGL